MAGKYDGAELRILNWDKYSHRDTAKLQAVLWFRAEVDLFIGKKRRKMPLEAKGFWMTILAWCADEKTNKLIYDYEDTDYCTGLTESAQDRYLDLFIDSGFLEVKCRNSAEKVQKKVFLHNKTGQDITRQEEEESGEQSLAEPRDGLPAALPIYSDLEILFRDRKVSHAVQERWIETFPDPPWVIQQIRYATTWEEANPKRRKKNFSAFITNWLGRDWDKRTGVPGSPPAGFRPKQDLTKAREEEKQRLQEAQRKFDEETAKMETADA